MTLDKALHKLYHVSQGKSKNRAPTPRIVLPMVIGRVLEGKQMKLELMEDGIFFRFVEPEASVLPSWVDE